MTPQRKKARAVAMMVLNQFDPKRNYAGPILDKLLHETNEKQRATDLVYGTIRNRVAIDTVIAKLAECPVRRIPAKLLSIICLAAYELIYCPQTPEHSIVNEAAESAKKIASKKQTGFVNAVLRQIARHISSRQSQLSQANAKATLPQTSATGCEFDTDFLPDPKTSPTDYLSTVFSLPKWLITDWLSQFGLENARQICLASNRRPSIYLRPNRLKTTTKQLVEKLRHGGIDADVVPELEMIKIKSPKDVTGLAGFAEGLFTVQDIAASQAVRLLQPKPSWMILDLCAAPGTKTTQIAEITNDKAEIVATDADSSRLDKVKENIARLGITSVNIVPYEKLFSSKFEILNSKFDCVLLDVPCSNTGVLSKRIEARYRLKKKAIKELAKAQGELLKLVATMIKPKGKICYSTCSIQKAENSELVKDFLWKNRDWQLQCEQLWLPSVNEFDRDGGYVAVMVNRQSKSNPQLFHKMNLQRAKLVKNKFFLCAKSMATTAFIKWKRNSPKYY